MPAPFSNRDRFPVHNATGPGLFDRNNNKAVITPVRVHEDIAKLLNTDSMITDPIKIDLIRKIQSAHRERLATQGVESQLSLTDEPEKFFIEYVVHSAPYSAINKLPIEPNYYENLLYTNLKVLYDTSHERFDELAKELKLTGNPVIDAAKLQFSKEDKPSSYSPTFRS